MINILSNTWSVQAAVISFFRIGGESTSQYVGLSGGFLMMYKAVLSLSLQMSATAPLVVRAVQLHSFGETRKNPK